MERELIKKLLVISSKGDVHADAVVQWMNAKGHSDIVVRFNTEDFLLGCEYYFDGSKTTIKILDSGREISSDQVYVVWYRRPLEIITKYENAVQTFVQSEADGVLKSVYYSLHTEQNIWINSLLKMREWRWKGRQLQLARFCGLNVPQTFITNNPKSVDDHFDPDMELCIKAINTPVFYEETATRSIYTAKASRSELSSELAGNNFHLIQQYIEKKFDVRVVIFGKNLFAFKIDSQLEDLSKIDFRGLVPTKLEHELIEIPDSVRCKIMRMIHEMGFRFSAMDFVVDQNGSWLFLENNCNGQWMWLEHVTGFNLTEKFCEYSLKLMS